MNAKLKTHSLALAACVAAVMLSGCAGSQSPIGTTGGMPRAAT